MIESGNLTMCAAVTLPMAIPGPASLALSYDRAGIERRLTHSGNFCYRVNSSRLIPSTDELAEFDADHLSHSPITMHLCLKRSAATSNVNCPGISTGLPTSSAAPVSDLLRMKQAIACPLNSMLAAVASSRIASANKGRPKRPGLWGRALGPPTNVPITAYGPRKRGPLQSVPDEPKQPRERLPVLQVSEV
jgi:hypothetical protein